jgi:hypothetical protein
MNLYEELLPYWKQRAANSERMPTNVWNSYWPGLGDPDPWSDNLQERGLECEWVKSTTRTPRLYMDCLVQGVMLFTVAAGLEP